MKSHDDDRAADARPRNSPRRECLLLGQSVRAPASHEILKLHLPKERRHRPHRRAESSHLLPRLRRLGVDARDVVFRRVFVREHRRLAHRQADPSEASPPFVSSPSTLTDREGTVEAVAVADVEARGL